MWQHFVHQISDVTHFELDGLVGSVRPDESALPPFLDHVEQFGSICILADRETRSDLPTEAMTITWLERNAETTFSVYKSRNVRVQIHRRRPGPACYGLAAIQGSQPLSRYGESDVTLNLTLGIAHNALAQTLLGFHRFEPVVGTVLPPPRAMSLTRQGISLP